MRHSVRLHHVITVYNDMFNHKDGIMGAFPKQKTPWKQDSYCAVKLAWQKLSKYYAKGTPTTGMHVVSADIIDPFRRLRSFRMWEKGMDINPEDVTSYTTQYQERSQKYVQNEYCAKHRHVPVIKPKSIPSNNLCPCATASGCSPCSNDPYHLSRDDEEFLIHNEVAKTTPRRSDCSACWLTTGQLYLNPPPESPKNWGQVDPNLNDYHSDPMEISITYWILDITN